MNIFRRALNSILGSDASFPVSSRMDINGKEIVDKKSISDPTVPFSSPRLMSYKNQRNLRWPSRVSFYDSEYDLATIANAIQLDGLLQRAVTIFVEQILKNDFDIVSTTEKAQKHARTRMREIELLTGVKFSELLTQISRQLVTYGNCYVIKVRKDISQTGNPYRLYNRDVKPIVGLFVADATTVSIGVNFDNQISHYRQWVRGQQKIFKKDDVIHLTYHKIPGTLTGCSPINTVLDDVRALRKLEEEVEILGFQYAIPLYLYQVGTESHPAQPGEVDTAANQVNNMPTAGVLVVPHTHDIKSVTSDSDPIDIIKFVEHFKRRIFAGLGVSPIAMGEVETSNRNTSEILDLTMQTITKSYQQIIKNKLEAELIREFLLDGGMSARTIDVEFRFPEIDLEAQIKKETHILQKYQGNLITLQEARLEADMEKNMNMGDSYLEHVQIPLIEAETQGQKEIVTAQGKAQEKVTRVAAAVAPKPAGASSGTKSKSNGKKVGGASRKKQKASTNSTKTKNSPTNQHGTSTRPRIKKDSLESLSQFCDVAGYNLLMDGNHTSQLSRDKFIERVSSKAKINIKEYLSESVRFYAEYHHGQAPVITDDIVDQIHDSLIIRVKDSISRLSKVQNDSLTDKKVEYSIKSVTNQLTSEDRLDSLAEILVLKNLGYDTILLNSENCDIHDDWEYPINDISFDKVPPLRYGCGCEIDVYRGEDGDK